MPPEEHDVLSIDDLDDAVPRQVEAGGSKILLWREGETVHAVGGTCPHAGAPLIEGVARDGRIVCPWHKAAFCLRTGALLEPPAVDPLPRIPVRIAGGRVILGSAAPPPVPSVRFGDPRRIIIVGAGAAGAMAAQTLRDREFGGRILMLDQENRVPYDRTLLSKYTLSGRQGGEKSPLQSQAFYADHRIERRTALVSHIDPGRRRITCADGSVLDYDAALVATGAVPTRPSLPGSTLANVFVLRSRADAEAILAQAERSTRVVVLGASFIGLEVAASLRERGLGVTVVAREAVPFEKLLGPEIGGAFVTLHRGHGVEFRFGAEIGAIEGEETVRGVRLGTGETLPADLVVIGFGVRPAVPRIEGVRLDPDGGVTVDATLKVAEGLYAAGDIARHPLQGTGDPVRVEHWRLAQQQGRVAALNMAGIPTTLEAAPVFWTIQYLKRLDYVGHATDWDDIVLHGDPQRLEVLAYYVKGGIVTAAAGFGRDRDTAALTELMRLRHDWTAATLGERPAEVLSGLSS